MAKDWAAHATHAAYVARAMLKILRKKTYGVYHVVSPGVPTYLEIAEFLVSEMKISKEFLIPVNQKDLGLSAARTNYLELSNELWKLDFGEELPSWKDGVRLFVEERFTKKA